MKRMAILSLAISAGLLLAGAAGAKDDEEQKMVERGQAHYLLFCANCHGVNADGKGPLVGLLKVAPADLTQLRRRAPDESVAEQVLKAVSGRHLVGRAGTGRMPVFSQNLEMSTVLELSKYLKTIQK